MANLLNWYEIPATDFTRAVKFYETLLSIKIHAQEMNGMKVGFMPQQDDSVGGAIMTGPGQSPSASGITIYFKAGSDLANNTLLHPAHDFIHGDHDNAVIAYDIAGIVGYRAEDESIRRVAIQEVGIIF